MCIRDSTKAYKKRYAILRDDFGSVFDTHTLQVLAGMQIAVVAALVALKEAAAAFLLVHVKSFHGCLHR